MWQEMLLLFRSASLLQPAFRRWVREEVEAGVEVGSVWKGLQESLM